MRGYHWSQAELDTTPADGIFYLAMNMTWACNYRYPYCFVGLQNLKTGKDEMTWSKSTGSLPRLAIAVPACSPCRDEANRWATRIFGRY